MNILQLIKQWKDKHLSETIDLDPAELKYLLKREKLRKDVVSISEDVQLNTIRNLTND